MSAGCDKDGGPLYVGRAYFRRNLLPAKIAPNHQTGYVSFEGAEHRVVDYEVLVTTRNVAWQSASGGRVPKAALPVGRTMQGETLYTGRVEFNSTLTPGKCVDAEWTEMFQDRAQLLQDINEEKEGRKKKEEKR
ncbi:hypothetical protein Cfor_11714 [Coptotermes formosanus]|uniref:Uncharacterized protein n=1 Tax=Coptotermes formosanus TaxID=36987 RepID=A0A6L2PMX2_COPFO|nr:hypothetical protein Cfor_11714 [Coptotermes formosanus]